AIRSIAAIKATRSKEVTSKIKLIQQKQYRRKISLMKKVYEYSRIYSADIYSSYYPTPTVITDRDLEKTREETVFREQR
ncbi:uncharacterized protein N7479_006311, partial [Penicillium vulpinum]|uniref:uncharacterized protein n=1 Tax=Penicillium vulpinum TaxID=29845 RepID=UPI0025476B30